MADKLKKAAEYMFGTGQEAEQIKQLEEEENRGMAKRNRGEHMVRSPHVTGEKGESDMKRYSSDMSNESEKSPDATGDSMSLADAMREVHTKIPRTVKKTGKTGAAKEAMLRAIAYSKAGRK